MESKRIYNGKRGKIHYLGSEVYRRTECMIKYNHRTWRFTTKPVTCELCLFGHGH